MYQFSNFVQIRKEVSLILILGKKENKFKQQHWQKRKPFSFDKEERKINELFFSFKV
jgi:hypothetical protein